MRRRLFNLIVLVGWMSVWSAAALHHHGHDCHHELQGEDGNHAAAHDHSCSHGHESPSKNTPRDSLTAKCRLCEFLATPLAMPQPANVETNQAFRPESGCLAISEPSTTQPNLWRGRAPPMLS